MLQLECPNCHVALKQSAEMGGVFYVCPSCGGRSAGMMLLSKLGLPWDFYNLLNIASRKTADPFARACPHCSRKMKVCELPSADGIMEVDVCAICKQVWFDPSEFQGLALKAPVKIVPEPLPQEALEIIALEKARYVGSQRQVGSDEYIPTRGDWNHSDDAPSDPLKQFAGYIGLPVEMDDWEFERRPYITWCFSFVFLAVAFLIYEFHDESKAVQDLGFITGEWTRFFGATIVTSFFLHGGIFHLLSNLYFFWVFADNVEDRLGKLKFLLLLFGSHIAGLVLFAVFDHRNIPTIGASGGIAGVMAYYAIMFPMSRIGFWFRWGYWFTLPAFLAFFLFIGLQILGASSQMSGYGGVNYLGHLGGVIVGVFAAIASRIWLPSALSQKPVSAEAEPAQELTPEAVPEPEKTEPPKDVLRDYNPDDYKR